MILTKTYLPYLKYLIKHKWFVFIECCKLNLPLHGILHDLSKFFPSEFVPYARNFYPSGEKDKTDQLRFDTAWLMHKNRNPHHWDYWVTSSGNPITMKPVYVKQMIADWRAMSRVLGGSAEQFYLDNKSRFIMSDDTHFYIELFFGFNLSK